MEAPLSLKTGRSVADEAVLHLAAAENAARVFDVSPTKIYAPHELEDAVCAAYHGTELPEPSRLEAILAEAATAPERAERLIGEVESLTQAFLTAAATALPSEFLAALYARTLLSPESGALSC